MFSVQIQIVKGRDCSMSLLAYTPHNDLGTLESDYDSLYLQPEIYHVSSLYLHEQIRNDFLNLKANIVDLNPAMVTKCIQGTEQDFIMLMNKAKEFLKHNHSCGEAAQTILMDLFQECIFGYYILTPLIKAADVSDIKVYKWNHITCKAKGKRYLTNLSFASEEDYNTWFERIMRIHRLPMGEESSLQHCTDRKGVDDFYLRIDIELKHIVSTECNNIHIRKMPKQKYTWNYLKKAGMLNDEMILYLKDRIVSGYSFLISGRGGSGKSTLLNNLIDLIPFTESVLVSQESDELYSEIHPQMQFEHTMEIRRNGEKLEYELEDELRVGLLQDIDNFVIGEIKGGEALYCFTTGVNTGARFLASIHSHNCAGSVIRLAQCARYISDYSMETLEEMLTAVPFCLIHMSNFSIDEILEIDGWDDMTEQIKYLKVYNKKDHIKNCVS